MNHHQRGIADNHLVGGEGEKGRGASGKTLDDAGGLALIGTQKFSHGVRVEHVSTARIDVDGDCFAVGFFKLVCELGGGHIGFVPAVTDEPVNVNVPHARISP